MRSIVLAFALLVIAAVPVRAQATGHPCDQPALVNPSTTSPFTVGFCHEGKAPDGQSVTAFAVYVDGAKVFSGAVAAIGVPSTVSGLNYYEVKGLAATKGAHVVTATASDADGESLGSSPFGFGVVGLVPAAPRVITVKK